MESSRFNVNRNEIGSQINGNQIAHFVGFVSSALVGTISELEIKVCAPTYYRLVRAQDTIEIPASNHFNRSEVTTKIDGLQIIAHFVGIITAIICVTKS